MLDIQGAVPHSEMPSGVRWDKMIQHCRELTSPLGGGMSKYGEW